MQINYLSLKTLKFLVDDYLLKATLKKEDNMRRICLFAGYDKDNKIQDYVIYLIKEIFHRMNLLKLRLTHKCFIPKNNR